MHRLTSNPAHKWVVGLLLFVVMLSVPAVQATNPLTPAVMEAHIVAQPTDPTPERGLLSIRSETPEPIVMRFAKKALPPQRPVVRPSSVPIASPTPLPTPVPPTDDWQGYVIPPPTPAPTPEPPPPPPSVAATPTGWPVAGGYISQYFSAAHPAIDISAPCGTAALAVWGGTVIWAGWKENGGGNVVDIQFDNGLIGSYNHMQAIYVGLVRVEAGTVIGEVGMTGVATGCHLHFAIQSGGVWVDPLGFL